MKISDKILLILESLSYVGIVVAIVAIAFAFSKGAKLEATILFVPLFVLLRCGIEARETREYRFKLTRKQLLIQKEILELN